VESETLLACPFFVAQKRVGGQSRFNEVRGKGRGQSKLRRKKRGEKKETLIFSHLFNSFVLTFVLVAGGG